MIIDYTYFTGLLSIGLSPDTGAPSTTRDAEREKIEYYIMVYEREYLRKILGENMCSEFIDYLNSEEDNVDKWEKLLALLSEKYSL